MGFGCSNKIDGFRYKLQQFFCKIAGKCIFRLNFAQTFFAKTKSSFLGFFSQAITISFIIPIKSLGWNLVFFGLVQRIERFIRLGTTDRIMKDALVQFKRAGKLLSSLRDLIAREYPEVKRSTQIIY